MGKVISSNINLFTIIPFWILISLISHGELRNNTHSHLPNLILLLYTLNLFYNWKSFIIIWALPKSLANVVKNCLYAYSSFKIAYVSFIEYVQGIRCFIRVWKILVNDPDFCVFHSNSMKHGEVVVHIDIDNYNFTNFYGIQKNNKKVFIMTHLIDGPFIKGRWICL